MALENPSTTLEVMADNVARQIVQQINSIIEKVQDVRAHGIPGQPAGEARTVGDKVIPGRPAIPPVPADAINAALGEANRAKLDAAAAALG